jgi:hypothetical protein
MRYLSFMWLWRKYSNLQKHPWLPVTAVRIMSMAEQATKEQLIVSTLLHVEQLPPATSAGQPKQQPAHGWAVMATWHSVLPMHGKAAAPSCAKAPTIATAAQQQPVAAASI